MQSTMVYSGVQKQQHMHPEQVKHNYNLGYPESPNVINGGHRDDQNDEEGNVMLVKYQQEFKLDQETVNKTLKLYNFFMKIKSFQGKYNQFNNDQCKEIVMKCAVFIASNIIANSEDKNQSCGLDVIQPKKIVHVTSIIQSNPQSCIDDFLHYFKDFQQTMNEAAILKHQTSIEIWQKLDIKDSCVSKACSDNMKKTAWLIYLIAKYEIYEKDEETQQPTMLHMAFLIISVIQVVVVHSNHTGLKLLKQANNPIQKQEEDLSESAIGDDQMDPDIEITAVQKFTEQYIAQKQKAKEHESELEQVENDDEEYQKSLSKFLMQLLEQTIVSTNIYQNVPRDPILQLFASLLDILRKLKSKNDLVASTKIIDGAQDTAEFDDIMNQNFLKGMFHHDVLQTNMKRLKQIYQQKLKHPNDLDERYFMNLNEKLKTPIKMVQSLFGARTGPMQRQHHGCNPPPPPQKMSRFSQRSSYGQQPGNKRQEVESNQVSILNSNQHNENNQQNNLAQSNQNNQMVFSPPGLQRKNHKQVLLQKSQPSMSQGSSAHSNASQNYDQNAQSQSGAADGNSNQIGVSPASKRVLDFNSNKLSNIENVSLAQKLNEVVFPKHINNSPFICRKVFQGGQKTVPITPITQMFELNNWQQTKISSTHVDPNICKDNVLSSKLLSILDIQNSPEQDKTEKTKELCTSLSSKTTEMIEKILEGLAKNHMQRSMIQQNHENFDKCVRQQKKLHTRNIRDMTAQILERVFISHAEQQKITEVKRLIQSSMFLKSVIICASELQFFVQNVKDMQIYSMIELIDQPPFDLWRILNIFLKLYPDMPQRMICHFREIEIRIVCELAWKRGSSVVKVLDYMKKQANQQLVEQNANNAKPGAPTEGCGESANQQQNKMSEKSQQMVLPYNFFFGRVLQASAQTTVELCQMLKIPEQFQEIIWNVIKCMLSCEPQLLINRHLDQLIMCTIYSITKISELNSINFNQIIKKYAQLFSSKEYVTQIYTQCVINQQTGNTKDIISFYNEVYLKQMKQYILLYKNQAKEANQNKREDPVKALSGQKLNGTNPPLIKGNSQIHQPSAILTPQGTKPFIKAFCPSTPLRDNYPSKNLSMRILYQKGNVNQSQMAEINSNAMQVINDSSENSKILKNGTANEIGFKRFEGLTGGKHTSFQQVQNQSSKVITPNPYDKLNINMENPNPIMTPNTMKLYSFGEQGPLQLHSKIRQQKVNILDQQHTNSHNSLGSKENGINNIQKPPRPSIGGALSNSQNQLPKTGYNSAQNLGIAIKAELPGEDPGTQMKKDLLNVITGNQPRVSPRNQGQSNQYMQMPIVQRFSKNQDGQSPSYVMPSIQKKAPNSGLNVQPKVQLGMQQYMPNAIPVVPMKKSPRNTNSSHNSEQSRGGSQVSNAQPALQPKISQPPQKFLGQDD